MTPDAAHRAIDAIWRMEAPRLIARLTRIVRDVGIAEELAQDALVVALEQWPRSGVPDKPGAWLMRAVAVSMAFGPALALELVEGLAGEPTLAAYHLLPSVRGDLLFKLGRLEDARAEFERAASLTRNGTERRLLLERAEDCQSGKE